MLLLLIALGVITLLSVIYVWRVRARHTELQRELALADIQLKQYAEKQITLQNELNYLREKDSQNTLIDALTNLPSRKVYEDRLKLTLTQSSRYQLNFAVLIIDIDDFKMINGALGYELANTLLKAVADRLATCIRQMDTISRFIGDEFSFILPQLSKAETAAYVAKRLLDAISQPFNVGEQELFITGSIGIATYPQDGGTEKALMQAAENALHQAKARGRNTYQFYRNEMQLMSQRELILYSNLRSGSAFQDFHLYCSPLVDLVTKNIMGMEAILQWQHADFGVLKLNEFIRLAENSGKITEIGDWLLEKACSYLVEWRNKNYSPRSILVPVSLRQLENNHFVHHVSAVLQEKKLTPDALIFEISGDAPLVKIEVIEKTLHMLKHVGVQIAISKFTSGPLALEHLRIFPIDILKIEGTLVKDITINKESEAIVKMIIALAKTLNVEVIADGVETEKQKDLLQELGCTILQGSLFGEPIKADEFENKTIAIS